MEKCEYWEYAQDVEQRIYELFCGCCGNSNEDKVFEVACQLEREGFKDVIDEAVYIICMEAMDEAHYAKFMEE